ncbi:MAG: XdhC family protein [Deltaproteobacteria bacterium]|nr:XdhC family protein [Deltaproteobacteria bacterium]
MKDIYQEIVQELSQGREIVLATIIRQKGSAPRTQGTQFLIRPDGTFIGTIGGGRLEADVLTAAPRVFSERKNRILYFRLKGEEVAETEMICGGEVDIYLELFSGQNPLDLDLFQKVLEFRETGRPGLLATLLEDSQSADRRDGKFLVVPDEDPDLEAYPWISPFWKHLPQVLEGNQARFMTAMLQGEEKKVFLEPLMAPSSLYIFGAGHISLYLCTMGKMVGFRVAVFDDRAEFANPQRFPEADEIQVGPFEQLLDDYLFGPNAFIVVVTRGHLHDHQIIRRVLKSPPRYIGMIGSRHKRGVVFKALKEEGFPEDRIHSIHSPIGLDIQAETPEEIAVSIVAELIQVRGKGRAKKTKGRLPALDPLSLEG